MYYRAAQAAIVVYDIRRQVCADGTLPGVLLAVP